MIVVFSHDGNELRRETIDCMEPLNLSQKSDIKRWIVAKNIDANEANILKQKLGLHPLTTEDMMSVQTRIKYEEHDDYTLIIFRAIKEVGAFEIKTEPVSVVFGESILVTVFNQENQTINNLMLNEHRVKYMLSKNSDFIGHYILDKEIDRVMDTKNVLYEEFKNMEREFLRHPESDVLRRVFKRELVLLELRQLSESTTDLCLNLIKPTDNYISNELLTYFKDVYDHTFKTTESLKTMLGRVNGMRNSYQSIISNKINETMTVLTIIMAIMMTMTIITGFYGMNVPLPLQKESYAYLVIIGLMVVTGVLTFFIARRIGDGKRKKASRKPRVSLKSVPSV
jgi:magnesium transporter